MADDWLTQARQLLLDENWTPGRGYGPPPVEPVPPPPWDAATAQTIYRETWRTIEAAWLTRRVRVGPDDPVCGAPRSPAIIAAENTLDGALQAATDLGAVGGAAAALLLAWRAYGLDLDGADAAR